jgi:chitinase
MDKPDKVFMILSAIAFSLSQVFANPSSYTRSITEPSGILNMQTKAERLSAPGKPDIWLVGAIHVGSHAYYSQVQSLLNSQDLVLYEGVRPTDSSAASMKPAATGPMSIYKVLSDAIGLDFQLNDINYDRPNWKNVDLSWERIVALNKMEAKSKSTGVDTIKSLLDPNGTMAKAFTKMITSATPGTREAFKLMIVKFAGGGFKSPLDPTTNDIVIGARNKVVVDAIGQVLAKPNPPKSIGVFYGAFHLPTMEQSLADRFGYREAEELWMTSVSVDPSKLDAPGKQLVASLDKMIAGPVSQKFVVGYLPNFKNVDSVLNTIDFSKLTHVDVAFENPTDEVGDMSFNPVDSKIIDKCHANHVKVLLSIGGGDVSENKAMQNRYFSLQSDAMRASFVAKLASYLKEHNFDGLDVDLEGAAIGKDYGSFVSDLSKALSSTHKCLSAAISEGNGGENIPANALDKFDFVNVMAYDGTGPWNPNAPGQHASLEFAKSTIAYWEKRGLPKNKLILGVPFYGYGFGPAYRNGDYSFSEIIAKYPGAENLDQVGNTIWYNGIPTIRAKAKFVMDEGLGGMMIWCLGTDGVGDKSLLVALSNILHPSK